MSLNGNWLDLVIIFILIFFVARAFRFGFWVVLVDLVSFLASLLISLRVYQFVAEFLRTNFTLSRSISNALGFLLSAVFVESILGVILYKLVYLVPVRLKKGIVSKFLAIFPAIGEGFIMVSFLLILALAFPISPKIKADITESKIGGLLIEKTSGVETKVNEVFGGVIEDALTFYTIKPESREVVELTVTKRELSIDEISETEMFKLVNKERKEMGVAELIWDARLVPVARTHATDMWERSYFGHISPEGEDIGGRLEKAGVNFFVAGENLALAPTLQTAHIGLMNSQGHRENILSRDFNRMGIGVIDNGVYGKMFVQIFID